MLTAVSAAPPPPSATASLLHFNALAAPFVPATAALGPPKAASTREAESAVHQPNIGRSFPVRRWYCQVLGPVFLKPLDEEQWKEEIERMTQVSVAAVAVNPMDGLRACITLSSTSESLALYNGRNMSSRNGTWTLIAERLVPIILKDTTAVAESSAELWDSSRAALQQLGNILGCDVFPHEGDDELRTDSVQLVVDVREGDAAYVVEWDGGLARALPKGRGGVVRGDTVRVERAMRPVAAPEVS